MYYQNTFYWGLISLVISPGSFKEIGGSTLMGVPYPPPGVVPEGSRRIMGGTHGRYWPHFNQQERKRDQGN